MSYERSTKFLSLALIVAAGAQASAATPARKPAPPAAPAAPVANSKDEDQGNEFMERFLSEFTAKIGLPRLEFDFEINSESKEPFRIDRLYAQATIPLTDALDIPLMKQKASRTREKTNDFTPTLELGEKDLNVSATFNKNEQNGTLSGAITFAEGGQVSALPLTLKINNVGNLRYRVRSVTMEIPFQPGQSPGDFKFIGKCAVDQQVIQLARGTPAPTGEWKPLKKCEFEATYDSVAKKPTYRFALSTR